MSFTSWFPLLQLRVEQELRHQLGVQPLSDGRLARAGKPHLRKHPSHTMTMTANCPPSPLAQLLLPARLRLLRR